MGGVGPRILMSTVECYGTHIPGLHVLQVGVCLLKFVSTFFVHDIM